MTNEIATTKSFQDRMKDKIREGIGDLLTDDDLKVLIDKGIDDVFFTTRYTGESYNRKEHPPLIHRSCQRAVDRAHA